MDNRILGTCSHGKQRLLAEDYDESVKGYRSDSGRSRRADVYYMTLVIVSVVACIFACISAACCYAALVEIQRLQNDKPTPTAIPTATLEALNGDTSTAPTSAMQQEYQYIFEGGDFDNEYEDYYETDSDEFDAVDEQYDYDGADYDYNDDEYDVEADIPAEGSGERTERGSKDFNEKSPVRTRRATKGKLEKCLDKCKGKVNSNEKKMKRCTRKCNKGGRTGSRKGRNNVPSLIPLSLPAAHFETAMNDNAIQDAVGIGYNRFTNAETCTYIAEMEGTLCLNRTFYPYKSGAPLHIFKPADWVDETSPVIFQNSVATAKVAGIFLIYAQAYIGGKEPEKSIRIVQKRASHEMNSFACNNGVHVDHFDSQSSQLQTCSVLGLMKLEKGDTIEIQKSAASLEIVLDQDKTYFGLVQLNSVAVPGPNANSKSKH